MAKDVIKEYAIQISIQGNKAVIKEFKQIDKQIQKGTKTLDTQNKTLKKTNSLLWTYAKRLIGVYAIYKMLSKGINLATNFAEQGNDLKNLSSKAQVSAKSLQKLGYVVKKFGGDEKSVAGSIGDLNRKIYERNNWGGNPFSEFTDRWGSTPDGDTIEDVLKSVARLMEGYSDERDKWNIGETLGLDSSLIEFLMQGEKAVSEQLKKAGVLFSDEDIANAEKAKQAMIDFNFQMDKLAKTVGGIVLEPLTNVIKELTDFLKDPKKYIANAFKDTDSSAYGTAKGMFDYKKMGLWGVKQILGLQGFSATTGRGWTEEGFDKLVHNVLGKDYEGAMALLGSIGSKIQEENQKYTDYVNKGGDVNIDSNLNININTEKLSEKLDEWYKGAKGVVMAVYSQASGGR